ncbi:zf-HC2 domain-containing protein [Acidobacteriota bacterium]
MDCSEAKKYLAAVLDKELDLEGYAEAIEHFRTCTSCSKDLEEHESIKEVISHMPVEEPTEKEWESLWPTIYSKITRGTGWILFIVSAVILLVYSLYIFLTEPGLDALLKVLIMGLLLGLFSLFASVAIERYHERKTDPYKEIEK